MRLTGALAACLALAGLTVNAATRLIVTAVEQKSGRPVTDLKAGDFQIVDDKITRQVEAAEFRREPVDTMLLLDTSLVGGMVQPVAASVIDQLQAKEQMAVVAFHSSADLLQDFTSSKELLRRAVENVKFGNSPRVLDALYAAIDGGFDNASYRRVIVLLTAGVEGPSRVSEREVLRIARRTGVSIFPVFTIGYGRSLFDSLARHTGGASFSLRDMQKDEPGPPGPRIFNAVRGHYLVTVSGNLAISDKLKVVVRRQGKLAVSALPLE